MNFKLIKKPMALFLILSLLVGCGSNISFESLNVENIKPGETISKDSKWINSNIDGAIVEDTPVNIKDDFNTAINRDWILETQLDGENFSDFSISQETISRRLLAIVEGVRLEDEVDVNFTKIDEAQNKHAEEMLVKFADLAGNWDERNQLGFEPIVPYIEAITQIDSMEDMNAYIKNENGLNFALEQIIPFSVGIPMLDRDYNTVFIETYSNFILGDRVSYKVLDSESFLLKEKNDLVVNYMLENLGFSSSEIKRILKESYIFEGKLASSTYISEYSPLEELDNTLSLEEIEKIQGNYPLTDILEIYGLNNSNRYTVYEPDYIKKVAKLYKESNLEEIKSFYIVKTLVQSQDLLDRESFEKYSELFLNQGTDVDEMNNQTDEEKNIEILLDNFVQCYLNEPLQMIYVDLYCSEIQKQRITEVVELIRAYFIDMIRETEWMSDKARLGAIEKLENMRMNVVYPENFTNFMDLDISNAENLVEAVALINSFKKELMQRDVNKPVEENNWDVNSMPLTDSNAYYSPTGNSVNILPGILTNQNVYRDDMEFEEILGTIGVIIGHEITHAFDTSGFHYDKDGIVNNWTEMGDSITFAMMATKILKYYNQLRPYPGSTEYLVDVSGEAIADFGGFKAALGIAAKQEDFDYELFFESYARVWRAKSSYSYVSYLAEIDPHPLAFLRVNVVVQQFDEFLETYDIKDGDGMYLAPEDRIILW